jgi:DNA-binding NarL/FixJ family response regulator
VINNRAKDIIVSAIARTGEEAFNSAQELKPDVILMDVRMPTLDGIESLKRIKMLLPNVVVLMLSTFDDDQLVIDAIKNGAAGYLLKNLSPNELIDAIRMASRGHSLFSSKAIARLAKGIGKQNLEDKDKNAYPKWYQSLTGREQEILRLITIGYSNSEISERLYIGEQTVRNYVSAIYSKLEVKDRAHAIRLGKEIRLD